MLFNSKVYNSIYHCIKIALTTLFASVFWSKIIGLLCVAEVDTMWEQPLPEWGHLWESLQFFPMPLYPWVEWNLLRDRYETKALYSKRHVLLSIILCLFTFQILIVYVDVWFSTMLLSILPWIKSKIEEKFDIR